MEPSVHNGSLWRNKNPLESPTAPRLPLQQSLQPNFSFFNIIYCGLSVAEGNKGEYTAFPSFLVLQVSGCSGPTGTSRGQGLLYELNNISISSQGTTEQDKNLPFSPRPFPTS